jgi:hypothetical protein
MTDPTRIVRLAEPGEVHGFGRLTPTDEPHPDYIEAAKIALDNPKRPVLVHSFSWPAIFAPDAPKAAQTKADAERTKAAEALGREVAADAKAQMVRLNLWAEKQDYDRDTIDQGIERFHVGSMKATADSEFRTFVVFFPEGRPVRKRRTKPEDPLQAIPPVEAADEEG